MTQSQEAKTVSPATERAELLISGAGERLGTLARTLVRRFRMAKRVQGEKADYSSLSEEEAKARSQQAWNEQSVGTRQPTGAQVGTGQLATVRAEEMVGRIGERMVHWARASNLQIRRAMAFLREGTEDMLVEAQMLRNQWGHLPH